MKIKKIKEIIQDLKESADVEKNCGLYEDLKKIKSNTMGSFTNPLLTTKADEFKLWADSWLIQPLNELDELIK